MLWQKDMLKLNKQAYFLNKTENRSFKRAILFL